MDAQVPCTGTGCCHHQVHYQPVSRRPQGETCPKYDVAHIHPHAQHHPCHSAQKRGASSQAEAGGAVPHRGASQAPVHCQRLGGTQGVQLLFSCMSLMMWFLCALNQPIPKIALKTLVVVHRLMRETDPSFIEEVRRGRSHQHTLISACLCASHKKPMSLDSCSRPLRSQWASPRAPRASLLKQRAGTHTPCWMHTRGGQARLEGQRKITNDSQKNDY